MNFFLFFADMPGLVGLCLYFVCVSETRSEPCIVRAIEKSIQTLILIALPTIEIMSLIVDFFSWFIFREADVLSLSVINCFSGSSARSVSMLFF